MTAAPLPLTYTDLVCVDDMDPYANETTSDLQNLIQDAYHVVLEDLGSNPDDPTRGFGLLNMLSGTLADFMVGASTLDAMLEQDTRIDSSSTTVVATGDPNVPYHLQITLVVDSSEVEMTVAVGPNGATLL